MTQFIKHISLCLLAITLSAVPVHAAEDGKNVRIHVEYSDSIKPQVGDNFLIEYKKEGSMERKTITIDASKLDGKVGTADVEPGVYFIDNLIYTGMNTNVEKEGYAIVGHFEVQEDLSGILYLGIGTVEGNKIIDAYENTFAVQQYHLTNHLDDGTPGGDILPQEDEDPDKKPSEDTSVDPSEKPSDTTKPDVSDIPESPLNSTEIEEPTENNENSDEKGKPNFVLGIFPLFFLSMITIFIGKKYYNKNKL